MIYVIGPITLDYIVTVDGHLHEGLLGGGAVYSAVGARLWTDQVKLVSSVHASFPRAKLAEFERHGISIDDLLFGQDQPKPESFFAYQQIDLQEDIRATTKYIEMKRPIPKSLLARENSNQEQGPFALRYPRPEKLPAATAQASGVHITSVDADSAKLIGDHLQQLRKPLVSFDPHSSMMDPDHSQDLRLSLQDVDLFSTSERQCRQFFRPERPNVWDMVEAFAGMGAKVIVVKRGERGQALFDSDSQRRWHIPAYPAQPVDVTGAGHTYAGAFLASFIESGRNLVEAAACAGAAASLAIEGVGWSYPLEAMPGLLQARRDRILQGVQPA